MGGKGKSKGRGGRTPRERAGHDDRESVQKPEDAVADRVPIAERGVKGANRRGKHNKKKGAKDANDGRDDAGQATDKRIEKGAKKKRLRGGGSKAKGQDGHDDEAPAEAIPAFVHKMESMFHTDFTVTSSPGKRCVFFSESQFFKARSKGYISAALDCDKSHQTALSPFPLIINDLTYVVIFLRLNSIKYDLTKIIGLAPFFNTGRDIFASTKETVAFAARTNLCQDVLAYLGASAGGDGIVTYPCGGYLHKPAAEPSQAQIDSIDWDDYNTYRDLYDIFANPPHGLTSDNYFLRERLSFQQFFYLLLFGAWLDDDLWSDALEYVCEMYYGVDPADSILVRQLAYLESVYNSALSPDATAVLDRIFYSAERPADSWKQEFMRRALRDPSYYIAGANAEQLLMNASGSTCLAIRLDYGADIKEWKGSPGPASVSGITDYFNDDSDVSNAFLATLHYNFVPGTLFFPTAFSNFSSDLLNVNSSIDNFLVDRAFQGTWPGGKVLARDTFMQDVMLSVLREANDKAYITAP
ncbi:unnamed protein product, partial [Prorocentrum cordatum]